MAFDEGHAQALRELDDLKHQYDVRVEELRELAEANQHLELSLVEIRTKAVAVAEEYEREPRQLNSTAVAEMLREWVGVRR